VKVIQHKKINKGEKEEFEAKVTLRLLLEKFLNS